MFNVVHDNAARARARWLAFFAAIALGAAVSGCGSDAPDAATEEGASALSIPYPTDPDTIIRYTVIGQDARGERTVHEGTITKAEQWRRMMMPDALEPSAQADPSTQGDEVVGEAKQAIENQVCWHGSPIVLNDQTYFNGNYLCFDTMDTSRSLLNVDSVSPGFNTLSTYSAGSPVLMYDSTPTLQVKWCTAQLNSIQSYTGPRIQYLQTGSSRWGICHF